METKILITDLTAMGGDRVCIAGVNLDLQSVRPVLTYPGVLRSHLFHRGQVTIRPRAVVRLQLNPSGIKERPHVEDYDWQEPGSLRSMEYLLEDAHWQGILERLAANSPQPLFGAELREYRGAQRRYVQPEEASFSLGTVKVDPPSCRFVVEPNNWEQGKIRYRLWFRDVQGEEYEGAAITDLALQAWVQEQTLRSVTFPALSTFLTKCLNQAGQVFLRLGLPRPSSSYMDRCWLQVNGIYSFPDWLEGRCFADFDAAPG